MQGAIELDPLVGDRPSPHRQSTSPSSSLRALSTPTRLYTTVTHVPSCRALLGSTRLSTTVRLRLVCRSRRRRHRELNELTFERYLFIFTSYSFSFFFHFLTFLRLACPPSVDACQLRVVVLLRSSRRFDKLILRSHSRLHPDVPNTRPKSDHLGVSSAPFSTPTEAGATLRLRQRLGRRLRRYLRWRQSDLTRVLLLLFRRRPLTATRLLLRTGLRERRCTPRRGPRISRDRLRSRRGFRRAGADATDAR
ncbi:MAG: hypothetical protein FD118_4269, partial [Rhodocyclaceae bacterium]